MHATSETITTDTQNHKVQDEEGNFPEEWMQALAFAEFVHRRLIWLPSGEATASINLVASIINATSQPNKK